MSRETNEYKKMVNQCLAGTEKVLRETKANVQQIKKTTDKNQKESQQCLQEIKETVVQMDRTNKEALQAMRTSIFDETGKNPGILNRLFRAGPGPDALWQCRKIAIQTENVELAIQREQHHHDNSVPRPCGWLPCFGLFEPKRTNARKKIKELKEKKEDFQREYQGCIRFFGLPLSPVVDTNQLALSGAQLEGAPAKK